MRKVEELTADNDGLRLMVAANYGGRWDISQAARRIAERVAAGEVRAEDITPETLHGEMSLAHLPEPDLFIRTGGEQRISNFLLWQLAYTELYFTEVLWPDFDRDHLEAAIAAYASRQRRFGHTSEQVERLHCLGMCQRAYLGTVGNSPHPRGAVGRSGQQRTTGDGHRRDRRRVPLEHAGLGTVGNRRLSDLMVRSARALRGPQT